jgi:type III secretory pathway component EscT
VWNYFFQAMIARIAFAVLIVPFIMGEDQVLGAISIGIAVIFTILLYIHVYSRILPETLPDKEKKRKRRTIRKMKIGS